MVLPHQAPVDQSISIQELKTWSSPIWTSKIKCLIRRASLLIFMVWGDSR